MRVVRNQYQKKHVDMRENPSVKMGRFFAFASQKKSMPLPFCNKNYAIFFISCMKKTVLISILVICIVLYFWHCGNIIFNKLWLSWIKLSSNWNLSCVLHHNCHQPLSPSSQSPSRIALGHLLASSITLVSKMKKQSAGAQDIFQVIISV